MMERTGTAELPKIRWILLRLALVCTAGVFAARRVESSAIVMAACSGKVEQHTEGRGVIYSPSWPLNYPAGMNCSWNIQGDKGDVITISFRNFDLEESGKCAGDWLLLGPTWREEYRVCGSLIPPPFISTRGHVWLHFHSTSTSSGQAQGFRLSYIRGQLGRSSCQGDEFLCGNGKCLPGSWRCNGMDECGDATDERSCAPPPTEAPPSLCPPGTFQCTQAQSTRCLPNTLRCNLARDCADGADEDNCPDTSCGKRLGNFYGSFASPDFFRPSRSPAELRCSWLVDTQDRKHILLQLDLQLGSGDYVRVYDGLGEHSDRLLQALSYHSNHRPVLLESSQGQLTVLYHAKPRGGGHGFNATYQVKGYCFPGERPCGSDQGCFSERQRCDGYWHCPSGKDEEGCQACQPGEYPCEGGSGACYPAAERCNNQKRCPDGSDEKNCHACQPGNFHCGTNLCIFETWRCDGQEDCQDGSDERDCLVAVPRKVITAALIGSLVCGLLLVVALGCAFKLYSLRAREYRAFETQMTRLEAEFVRREAPPSYGQLIAQGLIPPVEDFPVYNPSQASVLQNIRTAMRRQIRRHSSRRAASRRRLGRIWSRLFHRGTRLRGQIPLLTPPGAPHLPLGGGAHSYQAVAGSERHAPSPCSPPASEEPTGGLRRPTAGSPASEDLEGGACSRCRGPGSPTAPGEAERGLCPRKVSRKLVQGLAANLRGVSVRHYSSLDPPPPAQLRAEPPPAGPSGCRSVEVPILEDAGGLGGGRQPSSDEDEDDDESLLIC